MMECNKLIKKKLFLANVMNLFNLNMDKSQILIKLWEKSQFFNNNSIFQALKCCINNILRFQLQDFKTISVSLFNCKIKNIA